MSSTLFDIADAVETVRGTVTRVRYCENGRAIVEIQVHRESILKADGTRRPWKMTALGGMTTPTIGQLYEFCGAVTFSDRFKSHQIEFDSYRTILPTDHEGIFGYLVDVASWVGPATAKQLVDAFGSQTLAVLKDQPEKVSDLKLQGLTTERIEQMRESLANNERQEAATIEVNNLLSGALGPATVKKAIKRWGCDAATLIKADPYILTGLHGVGFHSADTVAMKCRTDRQDIRRHRAALVQVLTDAAGREGHTVVTRVKAEMDAARLVGHLRPEVWALCEQDGTCETGEEASVCLADLSKSEHYIAEKLSDILRGTGAGDEDDRARFPEIDKAGLATDQAAAVDAFRLAPLFALVGAPGTGKTFTVARIVRSLQAAGLSVALAAPTGKAAKQMSLALDISGPGSATTIHSLLAPTVDEDTGEFRFGRNEHNPLKCDVLILDEVSMIDARLMRSLLRAVPATCRLLLVGDHYQLPSVGPGAVLRDLLQAGIPHFELREIKRNAGLIVRACHAIKDGRVSVPCDKLDLDTGDNWRHIDAGDPDSIKAIISTLISKTVPGLGYDRMWGQQVISPTNEAGALSCDGMNDLAKPLLNPGFKLIEKLKFSPGDKVVRLKNAVVGGRLLEEEEEGQESVRDNSDEIRIVNGDVGVVKDIDNKTVTVKFRFPDRLAQIKRSEHCLKLAYCMTCHKLQGSECEVVILPLHRSLSRLPMVSREWIYTAFSRAKKILITVGDIDALGPMIARVSTNQRHTRLRKLFEELNRPPKLEIDL